MVKEKIMQFSIRSNYKYEVFFMTTEPVTDTRALSSIG